MVEEVKIKTRTNMNDEIKKSRRNFIDKGLKFGLLAAAGGFGLSKVLSLTSKSGDNSKKVQLMTADGKMIEVDPSQIREHQHSDDDYKIREGFKDKKFVMVIDLAKCKNAKKCVSSCNKMHYVTGENAWLKVYNMKDSKDSAPYWQPTICMHCDHPPCVKVCPVDATYKRTDGIVLIDNERCIGCRFCMAACPYSTRVFNWSEPLPMEDISDMGDMQHMAHTSENGLMPEKGTVSKCDFCPDMVGEGKLPGCVTACPNGVFYFGDKYEDTVSNGEETIRFSQLLEDRAGYRLLEDLGTEPNVYYLPPNDRLEDFEDGLENYDEFDMLPNKEKS